MNIGEIHRFSTPAKINLFLRVQRKRPDGYHDLLLDFHPVSLFDVVELQFSDNTHLELQGNVKKLAIEDNLAVKAVRILEKETGQTIPVKIRLVKNIPSGAGLGGGSGNAAGMLVILNRLLGLSISDQKLKELALNLGADVPFFISPRPSIAKGVGEQLTVIPSYNPFSLLLINPGFSISTAEAFKNCLISGLSEPVRHYKREEIAELKPEMNDFWEPLIKKYPELESCRDALIDRNAIAAGLSGSGSTVFGVFDTKIERDKALMSLEKKPNWQIYSCETMPRYDYPLSNT